MNEVTYKRELNHSYMVIRCETCNVRENYAYRMITQNRIGRLLQCSRRQLDGEDFFYYDISSRQPLERLYEERKLDVESLRRILYAIDAIQADLGEYLLDEQGLMLEAEAIFADVETEELYFCFDPERRSAEQRYIRLADFFLGHVDHGEEHAVNIAYQFYKMSKADYFVLPAFLPFLEKEFSAWRAEKGGLAADVREEYRERADAEEDGAGEYVRTQEQKSEAVLWEALQDADGQQEPEEKKKGWLHRIFGKRRGKNGHRKRKLPEWKRAHPSKKAAEEKSGEADWTPSIWDSYAGQEAFGQNGETVYFSDLDKPKKRSGGIPCLTEEDGDRQFLLEDLPLTVGKLKGKVSITLADSSVSRIHARFEDMEGVISVLDLNSRNGTLVNGRKLEPNESAALSEGDLVQFGRERFRYGSIPAGSESGTALRW